MAGGNRWCCLCCQGSRVEWRRGGGAVPCECWWKGLKNVRLPACLPAHLQFKATFPALSALHAKIAAVPGIATYLASEARASRPVNLNNLCGKQCFCLLQLLHTPLPCTRNLHHRTPSDSPALCPVSTLMCPPTPHPPPPRTHCSG